VRFNDDTARRQRFAQATKSRREFLGTGSSVNMAAVDGVNRRQFFGGKTALFQANSNSLSDMRCGSNSRFSAISSNDGMGSSPRTVPPIDWDSLA
jgi:hypothetical protein